MMIFPPDQGSDAQKVQPPKAYTQTMVRFLPPLLVPTQLTSHTPPLIVSDDWGDAPTVLHDRYGQEINPRSPDDDLEDWQRPGGVFGGVAARVRSLSRPNWARVPPSPEGETTQYGWAERVERAGGFDEYQRRRDEERAQRPVAMPVPNPAPGPIDVRGDRDEGGDKVGGGSGSGGERPPTVTPAPAPGQAAGSTPAPAAALALQPAALVRRNTRGSTRTGDGGTRVALGHRSSTTSSPTVIEHSRIPKRGAQTTPGASQTGAPGRPHLSRVEKIAAVMHHVASLPWLADSPVHTYYPPRDAKVTPPAEPFHTYDVPPSVPKRYRPPPPMPPCWYQPKQPKPKKPKKATAKEIKVQVAEEMDRQPRFTLDDSAEEFEYPDYYNYMNYAYTGDTPTLQSDPYTEESETSYDHYSRMVQNGAYQSEMDDYVPQPAYLPGPIRSTGMTTGMTTGMSTGMSTGMMMGMPTGMTTGMSTGLSTGLSTQRRPEVYQGPLQIMPPPDRYDEESMEEEPSPRGPIPPSLSTSYGRTHSRSAIGKPARTPLAVYSTLR